MNYKLDYSRNIHLFYIHYYICVGDNFNVLTLKFSDESPMKRKLASVHVLYINSYLLYYFNHLVKKLVAKLGISTYNITGLRSHQT